MVGSGKECPINWLVKMVRNRFFSFNRYIFKFTQKKKREKCCTSKKSHGNTNIGANNTKVFTVII